MGLSEVIFLGVVLAFVLLLLIRNRRGTNVNNAPLPLADSDRPEPAISSESVIAPQRSLGRPWRVDRGGRPSGDTHEDI